MSESAPTDPRPLKVSRETHRLIRLGAAREGCTMGAFLDKAVREFLAAHADEIEAGLAHARDVLGVT